MNDSIQFCPRCRKEVAVRKDGGRPSCSVCGTLIDSAIPPLINAPPPLPVARPLGRNSPPWYVIAGIILVSVVGFAIVGVAICYAGCVFIMNKVNH